MVAYFLLFSSRDPLVAQVAELYRGSTQVVAPPSLPYTLSSLYSTEEKREYRM